MDESRDAFSSGMSLDLPNDFFDSNRAFEDGGFASLSNALAAGQITPALNDDGWRLESPFQDLSNHSTAMSSPLTPGTPVTRPKIGSRFSRDTLRLLNKWLAVHQQHPYPKEDDLETLQQRTGLSRAQLTNWFANARRRGKVQSARPVTPQVNHASTGPVDIIPRPGTPATWQDSRLMDPMQRWVESPPEHEPATVSEIARAMAANPKKSSYDYGTYDFGYGQSPYALSSASSAGTSQSSNGSNRNSADSQSSLNLRRKTRKKRASRRRRIDMDPVMDPTMPYQCTFCTEVFKSKHDWARHEKTLHLPLEQWVCALHGPRAPKIDITELCCVFCGAAAPDDLHVETHNYSACVERDIHERTFHRKDHLVQHLRLVHGAKFEAWSMSPWMLSMPDITSRCGFCAVNMSTWVERTDHIAEHFKSGLTMADWQGDWGFEERVLQMVESAVPPYIIDHERTTMIPMKATDRPLGSPPNGYELIKVEIEFFVQNYFDETGQLPSNDSMQLEACRTIFAAEASADQDYFATYTTPSFSWLRDLIMSSEELAKQARFGPIKTSSESRHYPLQICGKDQIFEQCPLETRLDGYVTEHKLLGKYLDDGQLQNQACEAVRWMEKESSTPSDMFANWLVKGIYSGTAWLSNFKQRVDLLSVIDTATSTAQTGTVSHLQSTVWSQEAYASLIPSYTVTSNGLHTTKETMTTQFGESIKSPTTPAEFNMNGRPRAFVPEDTNFFRSFETDIRRWVKSTMSKNNPNCHVPSDAEIQHQARCVMYDSDDPWNQTPADYVEWLWRFKKNVGILTEDNGINPAQLNGLR